MKIAPDYDGTYTADRELWDSFILHARQRGHEVHIVTMRFESEPVKLGTIVDAVHYTSRTAKKLYMSTLGLYYQIWIDDQPELLFTGAI